MSKRANVERPLIFPQDQGVTLGNVNDPNPATQHSPILKITLNDALHTPPSPLVEGFTAPFAAQNNANPQQLFADHAVVYYKDPSNRGSWYLFDPSYGVSVTGTSLQTGTASIGQEWAAEAIAGGTKGQITDGTLDAVGEPFDVTTADFNFEKTLENQ